MNLFIFFVLLFMMSMTTGQFYGCDYYQPLVLNQWYDIFSPNFPQNYQSNVMCRWTGRAPAGSNIIVNCTFVSLPSTSYCTGDRIEVSYAGCQDLRDAQRYCSTTRFIEITKSNALVMALKVSPNTEGGKFFCQIKAVQSSVSAQQMGPIRFPASPVYSNTYPIPQQPFNNIVSQQPAPAPVDYTGPFRTSFQPPYQPVYQPSYQQINQQQYQPVYQPTNQPPYQPVYQQPYQQQYQPVYQPTNQINQNPSQVIYQPSAQPVFHPMSPQSQPQCQCGLRKRPRIVGGVETDINEFPFMCGIMDMVNKRVICGCIIISEIYVLTTAHCVINQTLNDLGCIVGNQDYTMQSNSPYTSIYRFAGFIPYPNYDHISYVNDIAIMKIYGQIQFNPGVSAICLPLSYNMSQNSYMYSQVEAVGWGKTSFGGTPSTSLKKVKLTVIPNYECNKNYPYQITSAQMCTFTPLKDACEDDGGPLIFTDTFTGRSFLTGLISYGVACASRMPRVHTRITSYLSWMLSTTNGTANFCVV